jgi:hypothetical protein
MQTSLLLHRLREPRDVVFGRNIRIVYGLLLLLLLPLLLPPLTQK